MFGRVQRWTASVLLACGASAVAQPWPAVSPAAAADSEPVYVMRTAGQMERTIKVVRQPLEPEGQAEVMDTATKQTFWIPGKVLAKLTKAIGAKPQPQPQPKPAPSESEPKPQAKVEYTPPPQPTPPLAKVEYTPPPQPKVEYTPPPPLKTEPVARPQPKVEYTPPPAPEPQQTTAPTPEQARPIAEAKPPVVAASGTSDALPWWKEGDPLKPVQPVIEVTRPLPTLASDRWRSTVGPTQTPPPQAPLLPMRTWKTAVPTTPPSPTDPWRAGG